MNMLESNTNIYVKHLFMLYFLMFENLSVHFKSKLLKKNM